MAPGPLSGLTILDLTRVLSGPYCTMLLADMGARVIKIEQPGCGDETRSWGPPFVGGESTYFLSINRNKESVALDIKAPAGRAALDRLIARADVVVENFRPGTLARMGLDYEALRHRHPHLVFASISGFGHTGPRREHAGYDAVMQAEGGLMSITGDAAGEPYRMGVAIVDLVAGMFAVQGILLALYAQEKTGAGQSVDVSLFDSTIALLSYQASAYLNAAFVPTRMGNRHPTIAPYDTVAAADGEFFLAVGNDDQFRRCCEVIGVPELASDPRFTTNPARVANYTDLRDVLAVALRQRPRDEWLARLTAAGVPCGAVRDIPDVLADPQVEARHMIEAVEHVAAGQIKVLGVPVKMSDTPGSVRTAPPTLGQHTESVLREIGIDEATIAAMKTNGVI
jgi:crotonobetainyl-CoA:carnitine CoA-transferase CaiB-like acyl-CoA transferase